MSRVRTGYSFSHAVGHLPDVMARLKTIGRTVAPITDRNSTFGFTKWSALAKKNDMCAVFGAELGVVNQLGEKKQTLNWCTFLAKQQLRPLHDLIYAATSSPGKEPSLLLKDALAAQGVHRIIGERATLDQFEVIKGTRDTYMALSPSLPMILAKTAREAGVPFIAASDNVYPAEDDFEFYRVTLGKDASAQTYPQHILSDDELRVALARVASPEEIESAFINRDFVLDKSRAELTSATMISPERPASLRELCEAGAKRTGTDLSDPIYAERLTRELTLIDEKDFADYFYLVADIVNWAKQRMIVGPARGSSCGSLVCYLLGITSIDPIPYGLLFERFIDVNRTDLPDVDIDFSDKRRNMVFEYMEQKYGTERVARLGTVGLFKPRSALKQTAASLWVPGWRIEKIFDSIIERSSGDARAMLALEDTLNSTEAGRALVAEVPNIMIAARMEGHPNNPSQHAAGMLVTQDPIIEFVAVDARTKSAMLDKKDAEKLNLLKIDALGLTQLSIFERTLQLIGVPDKSGWLEQLPLDDQAAFDVLNELRFAGIFQFMGRALQSVVKQTRIEKLDDIVAITALARPGPMATGGATAWVRRKNGLDEITTAHPMLTDLTRDTYGVTIYQEQVMMIVRVLGKMSWEDTSAIRKAMSGRLGNEFFEGYWQKFRAGAIENGIEEEVAKAIWEQINTFGSWAFNRSHAVAYGIVSYYSCWLKAHHPMEFAAATLDAEADTNKQIQLLRELHYEGIDYVPFDAEHSVERWTVAERDGKKVLVGPLTSVHGIGPAGMNEILTCRKRGEPVRPAMAKKLTNARTGLDSIFPVRDAIKRLHPDLAAVNIFTEPTPIINVQLGTTGEVLILACVRKIAPRDVNEEVNVQKRGYKLKGPSMQLNMFVFDDTDEILAKIDRFKFEKLARPIIERGKAGKALYAIKGTVPDYFRMMEVKQVRFLGFVGEKLDASETRGSEGRETMTEAAP